MPLLDLTPDELLSTTRAVRKRLDLTRPVEPELLEECVRLAIQAPTSTNTQNWHFVVVTDEAKRAALASSTCARGFRTTAASRPTRSPTTRAPTRRRATSPPTCTRCRRT